MSRLATLLVLFGLWSVDSWADRLTLEGAFIQGGLVTGSVPPGSKVIFDGAPTRVSETGRFLIGFSRDAAPKSKLTVTFADGQMMERSLSIEKRTYQVQRIVGLPRKMVTPPKSVYARIRK